MKILSAEQTRKADEKTIENEPISSLDLMERAARGLFKNLRERFSKDSHFAIFCGKGNNGGDGLALARMLAEKDFSVRVFLVGISEEEISEGSGDFQANFERLPKFVERVFSPPIPHLREAKHTRDRSRVPFHSSNPTSTSSVQALWGNGGLEKDTILIDAILGSGLSRPLEGFLLEVVQKLNSLENQKVAIDIPTGLLADDNSENDLDKVLEADLTLTFHAPKFSFFHRDSAPKVGEFQVIDIKLDEDFIEKLVIRNFYISTEEIQKFYKKRPKFSYKNMYGHALLLAGQEGSYGAAILSATAAMRAGAGLLTVHTAKTGLNTLQTAAPEAQVSLDSDSRKITQLPDLEKYAAIGMGCGIGTEKETLDVLKSLLEDAKVPLVLDADALNLLAQEEYLLKKLPEKTILTPHIGEFKKLLGIDNLEDDYLDKLQSFSKEHTIITILKDSITIISDEKGKLFCMDEGTPALASGGSGDVLTGIVLGLLSSGYEPVQAAQMGVWLQGNAGKLAEQSQSTEAALARDVVENLGGAFRKLLE